MFIAVIVLLSGVFALAIREIIRRGHIIGDLRGKVAAVSAKHEAATRRIDEGSLRIRELDTRIVELNKEIADADANWEKYAPMVRQYHSLEGVLKKLKDSSDQHELLTTVLKELQSNVDLYMRQKMLVETGFYTYRYEFEDVVQYKEALQIVREAQRRMISERDAVTCSNTQLEDSTLVKNIVKLALVAFNNEVELVAERLTSANFESCKEKVEDHFDFINELLSVYKCKVDKTFLGLKVKELAIALEYELMMERIREEQNELKDQMRDEEVARDEAERAREEAIEEEEKFEELLAKAKADAENASQEKQAEMQAKIRELEMNLEKAHEERERATSNAQKTRKGSVYIISNIGSFGENVFKIGLTRRDNPMERVRELGDASVPFTFDVHAVINAEDAPTLETRLHEKLSDHRMNMVNMRKEFFRVTIDQIASVCKELGCEVAITQMAEAHDFRKTAEMLKERGKAA